MNIPVDGIALECNGVTCNESAMTGESDELRKDTLENCLIRKSEKDSEFEGHKDGAKNRTHHDLPSPVMLSGTQFATGEGWYVCIVVGNDSCVGKILSKLEQRVETTPLQDKLEAIATDIGKLGIYAALLTVHILLLRFFVERLVKRSFDLFGDDADDGLMIGDYLREWLGYFVIGVAIVVVAVPEGLPLAVMVALAFSVKKMLND